VNLQVTLQTDAFRAANGRSRSLCVASIRQPHGRVRSAHSGDRQRSDGLEFGERGRQ